MRLRPMPCLFALLLNALAVLPASAHKAKDFLDQQDFSSTPPAATSPLKDWIAWTASKQDGSYHREGGQPFAEPVPPGLLGDIEEITIEVHGGSRKTVSGGVTCWESWYESFTYIVFDDGSEFVWMDSRSSKTCSDGSSESFIQIIGTAGVTDPVDQSWTGWVRSWSGDNLQLKRRAAFRAPAGGKLELTGFAPSELPWIGSEYDEVDIVVGPGGVLDLTGNPAANGPIFSTSGPVTLYCDTVLMDPGVVLSDLFTPPPVVLPGVEVHELEQVGPAQAYFDAAGPAGVELRLLNLGNAPDVAQVSWIDNLGWSLPGPAAVPLQAGELAVPFQVPLFVPPFAQPGDASSLLVQVGSAQAPVVSRTLLLERVDQAQPPTVYCTAKQNSQGCVPKIASSGSPTATGYDDFHVLAGDVLNGMNGILFYGFGAVAVPLQGGTLCVQGPVVRTPAQSSGGNQGSGTDCTGLYAFHFSHSFLASKGLAPGTDVWCQYWTRDPAASFGSGLSDGLAFLVSP